MRLAEQVQPDKIKLLTPQQVAALGPAKVAALADVCVEWGPLSEADRARALADLEPLALGKLLTQRRVETTIAFWVFLPPVREPCRGRAARGGCPREGRRRRFVVDAGPQRFAISLGAFRTEEAAQTRLAQLVAQGDREREGGPAPAGGRADDARRARSAGGRSIAKLRDLVPAYPGSEAKVGGCEKAP